MRSLDRRLSRLEAQNGTGLPKVRSVRFVETEAEAHTPIPKSSVDKSLWGLGLNTWRVFVACGQSRDDALRAAGVDLDRDTVIAWN